MAFLRLWLTANLVIALYNFVNALLTTGNQKLYLAMIGTGRKRTGSSRGKGWTQEKGQKEASHFAWLEGAWVLREMQQQQKQQH